MCSAPTQLDFYKGTILDAMCATVVDFLFSQSDETLFLCIISRYAVGLNKT